jgi:hypothetical protein
VDHICDESGLPISITAVNATSTNINDIPAPITATFPSKGELGEKLPRL